MTRTVVADTGPLIALLSNPPPDFCQLRTLRAEDLRQAGA